MPKKWAYYNEIDAIAAEWLRQSIKLNLIAPGEVDERSIEDVVPDDLRDFCQVHLFAGVGTWSYALRNAGWSDDLPVWTGSPPCQPFSAAGLRKGTEDDRHLFPAMLHLVNQCRPDSIFMEQVSSSDGRAWLDDVCAGLEGSGYSTGAIAACAAGVGAPHLRQRLYIAATTGRGTLPNPMRRGYNGWGSSEASSNGVERTEEAERSQCGDEAERLRPLAQSPPPAHYDQNVLGNASGEGLEGLQTESRLDGHQPQATRQASGAVDGGVDDSLLHEHGAIAERSREADCLPQLHRTSVRGGESGGAGRGSTNGFWADAVWLPCRDGKFRSTKPGVHPLVSRSAKSSTQSMVDGSTTGMGYGGVTGIPAPEETENTAEARKMRIKGYGNGIVAPQVILFISSFIEAMGEPMPTIRPKPKQLDLFDLLDTVEPEGPKPIAPPAQNPHRHAIAFLETKVKVYQELIERFTRPVVKGRQCSQEVRLHQIQCLEGIVQETEEAIALLTC